MLPSSPNRGHESPARDALRPPWTTEERIRQHCTSCGKCIAACPEGILTGGRAGTPAVRFAGRECTFCGKCAAACAAPVFADTAEIPWNLTANVRSGCLLMLGVACQSCTDACDMAALRYEFSGGPVGSISIVSDLCTGCGACLGLCPTQAITVEPRKAGSPA